MFERLLIWFYLIHSQKAGPARIDLMRGSSGEAWEKRQSRDSKDLKIETPLFGVRRLIPIKTYPHRSLYSSCYCEPGTG